MDKMQLPSTSASSSGQAPEASVSDKYEVAFGQSDWCLGDPYRDSTDEVTANKVADYILWLVHDVGDLITNLKLQKLVYYAQAWYLALYDKPLFAEHFEAWVHGPVQPQLYQRFKSYRWDPILYRPRSVQLPNPVKQHIQEIMEVFGDYSAYTLERMVHSEDPWINARRGLTSDAPSRTIISTEDMRAFYRQLTDDEAEAS